MNNSYPISLSSIAILTIEPGKEAPKPDDFTQSLDVSYEVGISSPDCRLAVRLDFRKVKTGLRSRSFGDARCRLSLVVRDTDNFTVAFRRFCICIEADRDDATTIQFLPTDNFPTSVGQYRLSLECDGDNPPLFDHTFIIRKVPVEDEGQRLDKEIERAIRKRDELEKKRQPARKRLERLTGLENVKRKIFEYETLMTFDKRRQTYGLHALRQPLHSMFLGSPGTGKTTVAKLMGELLKDAGVLSRGHVVVRERATLMGKYYGSQEEKTLEAIQDARGGILFIDEAYQLYPPDDPRDPARIILETLLTAMADEEKRDWMLILAGYTEPMKEMFDKNPGFRSRIPETSIFTFEDYSVSDLMEIATRYFEDNSFLLSAEAHEKLHARLSHDWLNRDSTFGNARHVVNLIQTEIIPAMAMRLSGLAYATEQDLRMIEAADIPGIVEAPLKSARKRLGFCA